jgi:hypothetical protein
MLTEEEGLKNWIAFFWRVTACVLKVKLSEETTVYIFRVEGRAQNFKMNYLLTKNFKEIFHATETFVLNYKFDPAIINICM